MGISCVSSKQMDGLSDYQRRGSQPLVEPHSQTKLVSLRCGYPRKVAIPMKDLTINHSNFGETWFQTNPIMCDMHPLLTTVCNTSACLWWVWLPTWGTTSFFAASKDIMKLSGMKKIKFRPPNTNMLLMQRASCIYLTSLIAGTSLSINSINGVPLFLLQYQ